MQGEETGRSDLGSQFGGSELTVIRIEGGLINPLDPRPLVPKKDRKRFGVCPLGKAKGENREEEMVKNFHESERDKLQRLTLSIYICP